MNQRLPLLALILTSAWIARGVEAQPSGLQTDSGSQASVPHVPQKALLTMTGNKSDVRKATYRVARSQEVFDELWAAHMGARINRATQGWPMPPHLDFDRVQALLLFRGDSHNSNGYRIEEIVEEPGRTRVRVDLITYQSDLGSSKGAPRFLNPWALMVLPASEKTLIVEENKQGLKDHPARWEPLATFPGRKGMGTPVQGSRQTQSSD